MSTDGIQKKERARYIAISKELRAELLRRGLTVRGLARRYGISHFTMGRILAGWGYRKVGKWQEVKERLLKDFPWLKVYIG